VDVSLRYSYTILYCHNNIFFFHKTTARTAITFNLSFLFYTFFLFTVIRTIYISIYTLRFFFVVLLSINNFQ